MNVSPGCTHGDTSTSTSTEPRFWWGTGGDVVHSAPYCFFTSQPESTDASTLDAPCLPPEPEG